MFFDPKTKKCYGKLMLQTSAEAEQEDRALERTHVPLSETRELGSTDLEFAERAAAMHTDVDVDLLDEMRAKDGRKLIGIPKI